MSNLMKIRPVAAELFYADGRTERLTDGERNMAKLIVAFRNVAKTPKLCGTMRLFPILFVLCSRREHSGNREQHYCPCR
jgi:hypothetical protein